MRTPIWVLLKEMTLSIVNASAVTLTNDVQWLKILVDPKSRELFAYQAQIVPGNRVAVPAP